MSEVNATIHAMWLEGAPDAEIADAVGLTRTAVRKRRQRNGWTQPQKRVRDEILAAHERGANARQAAELAGATHRTAQQILWKAGVDTSAGRRRLPDPPGEQLRAWRKGHGWSQAELGERVGVSALAVGYWERGGKVPSQQHAELLTELGCPVDWSPHRKLRTPPPAQPSTPGEHLRAWRIEQAWSQAELGALVGVTGGTLGQWETGRRVPQPSAQVRLRELGCPAVWPPKPTSSPVGAALRAWRMSRGWSQAELAKRLSVSRQVVSLWELGRRPSRASLEQLAELGCPVEWPAPQSDPRDDIAAPPGPGADLRAWRLEQGWTQAELGERLGVLGGDVSAWERGRVPRQRSAELLTDLGCPVDWSPHRKLRTPPPAQPSTPGEHLRAWRIEQAWSQAELAAQLDVSGPLISLWERNGLPRAGRPRRRRLRQLKKLGFVPPTNTQESP